MTILENASEAIEKKGEIGVKTRSQDGDIKIEISDSGIGIPADNMGRVFDPGFTTKGVGVGTGLGLSICYKIIVDEHKGKIDVFSEVNKGTTFRILIPQRVGDERES